MEGPILMPRVYHLLRDWRIPAGSVLANEGEFAPPPAIKASATPLDFAERYEAWLVAGLREGRNFRRLAGKNLVCSCSGGSKCPSRILFRLANAGP